MVLDTFKTERNNSQRAWCSVEDVQGTTNALTRIQATYLLSAVDLARGIFAGKATKSRLSVSDCMRIAKYCLDPKNGISIEGAVEFALAIEWIEAALQ